MYNLSCDVTGITIRTGVAVNTLAWSGPGITGKGHYRQQLSLSPVTLDVAGHYKRIPRFFFHAEHTHYVYYI